MGKERIEIEQSFNAPVETIFNILTDHEIIWKCDINRNQTSSR